MQIYVKKFFEFFNLDFKILLVWTNKILRFDQVVPI